MFVDDGCQCTQPPEQSETETDPGVYVISDDDQKRVVLSDLSTLLGLLSAILFLGR